MTRWSRPSTWGHMWPSLRLHRHMHVYRQGVKIPNYPRNSALRRLLVRLDPASPTRPHDLFRRQARLAQIHLGLLLERRPGLLVRRLEDQLLLLRQARRGRDDRSATVSPPFAS